MSYSEYSKCPPLAHMQLYGDASTTGLWQRQIVHLSNHQSYTASNSPHPAFLSDRLAAALCSRLIFNWIKVGVVGRPKICRNECSETINLLQRQTPEAGVWR